MHKKVSTGDSKMDPIKVPIRMNTEKPIYIKPPAKLFLQEKCLREKKYIYVIVKFLLKNKNHVT